MKLMIDNATRFIFCLGFFCLAFYPPYTDKLFILACILSLLGGQFKERYQLLKANPVTLPTLLLIGICILGVFYGPAPLHDRVIGLGKYLKLLYILFLFHLFLDPVWRKRAENFLILGVGISILGTLLYNLGWIDVNTKLFLLLGIKVPTPTPASFFMNPLIIGPFTLFCCILILMRIMHNKVTTLGVVALIYFYFYVFFINAERSIVITLILMTLFLVMKTRNWKIILASAFLLLALGITAYHNSETFQKKTLSLSSTQNAHQDESIHLRTEFVKYSWQLIKAHPIIGTGTGSFGYAYSFTGGINSQGETVAPGKGPKQNDPHNEYVTLWVQLGIIGLGIFVFWLYRLSKISFSLSEPQKSCAQLLMFSLIILSFTYEEIAMKAGLFYVGAMTLYFANAKKNRHK